DEMSGDQYQKPGFVARLLRKQQSLGQSHLQFTTRSLLLGTGYVACLVWLLQFIVRSEPLGIPLFMHLWFLALWISVIGGSIVAEDAWWYLVAGLIGVGFSSPLLLNIFANDLEPIPLTTGWATSFSFAMFANLGGAIGCFRNRQERMAVLNAVVFTISFAVIS